MSTHSPLREWNSCPSILEIPRSPDQSIKKIHIYDFDNTLYNSPQPNRQLYSKRLYDQLFHPSLLGNLGWWSEPSFLEQSFNDMLSSDDKGQAQFWNAEMIDLAKQSYLSQDTLSIVLTGRKEHLFHELFSKMFIAFGKVHFNATCLRRENVGSSTIEYKLGVIDSLLDYYSSSLEEITIYDDRLGQIKQFQNYFKTSKCRLKWLVITVQPHHKFLSIQDEYKLIFAMFEKFQSQNQIVLEWTSKQYGFFLSMQSHKSLISWSFRFFQKKYRMGSFPQYPTYIPCTKPGERIPEFEIAKIWSDNDRTVLQSPSKIKEIQDTFYSQQASEGTCIINFDVIGIGYRKSNKLRNDIEIVYKARPSNIKRYIWSTYPILFIIDEKENTLMETVVNDTHHSIKWVHIKKPLKIKTTFGHASRLTIEQQA